MKKTYKNLLIIILFFSSNSFSVGTDLGEIENGIRKMDIDEREIENHDLENDEANEQNQNFLNTKISFEDIQKIYRNLETVKNNIGMSIADVKEALQSYLDTTFGEGWFDLTPYQSKEEMISAIKAKLNPNLLGVKTNRAVGEKNQGSSPQAPNRRYVQVKRNFINESCKNDAINNNTIWKKPRRGEEDVDKKRLGEKRERDGSVIHRDK